MEKAIGGRTLFRDYWLTALIAAQPLLDVLAFWTRSSQGTLAGYIRLGVLLALPLYLLLHLEKKKGLIISLLTIGAYCALHVLNGYRVGYLSLLGDVSYMLKVVQMPVLTVCFVFFIRDEKMRSQAQRGILAAAVIYLLAFVAAYVSGTSNSTYGVGLGVSGWVIADNRCANSIILATLSTFAVGYAASSKKAAVNILIPLCVAALLIANGTKACYGTLFVLFIGYTAFMIMNRFINGERINTVLAATLLALTVVAVVIYPYTPRAKVSADQAEANRVNEIQVELTALGYDLDAMSTEEKMAEPTVRKVYEHWYRKYIYYVIPDLIDRFGMESVLLKYDMTYSSKVLGDTRQMKVNYASMIFERSDTLTKLVGFEFPQLLSNNYDLENDYAAILCYYGYLGSAMYAGFLLYFLLLVLKRLREAFKESFNLFNFSLIVCLAVQLGLAQFSGALLRRPNGSIYLALVLALIYYRTVQPSPVPAAWGSGEKP